MITYIDGVIKQKELDHVLIIANKLGYLVSVGEKQLQSLQEGDSVELYVKTFLRDDHFELYGFLSQEPMDMFDSLMGVSGVGPKMAMGVLNKHSVDEIKKAILTDDVSAFTAVSGIGKKNASRIILELKSKMGAEIDISKLSDNHADEELEQALQALGYSKHEISKMATELPPGLTLNEKIKHVLRGN